MKKSLLFFAVLLTTATAWAETVWNINYIDANGNQQTAAEADVVTTSMQGLDNYNFNSDTDWFYVNSDVTLEGAWNSSYGTYNIILGDGATLTVNGQFKFTSGSLNIYCQSGGTGKLVVSGSYGGGGIFRVRNTLTINGGTVEATNSTSISYMYAFSGNLVMNGGSASFTCNKSEDDYAISGNVTLNNGTFTARCGSIQPTAGGTLRIGDGKCYKDNSNPVNYYIGTLTNEQKKAINGKTLQPATQTEYIVASLGAGNDGSAEHPYTISDAAGWDAFCLALEDIDTWNGFSGKTVKLGNDISVSRIAGSGNGSNLTTNDHPFCGTFDGGGKKLTFNYGSDGNPADENNLAPFRYVNNATIQHLHIDGNIYTQHVHAGGIIGMAYGTTNVTDCRSSINIISSINGDGTHGGIMSCSWTGSTTNITGCLFDGSIQSATNYTTNQCGGFVGWRNATINVSNSLMAADLSTIATPDGLVYPSATFVRNGVNNNITNSYYTSPFGIKQGKQLRSITAGEYVSVENAGTPETVYATSGITAYPTGIMVDSVLYAGNGDEVALTLGFSGDENAFAGYVASAGTLSGSENPYTLTMPDEDVVITANTLAGTVAGDANEDGEVDVMDITSIINYILGKNPDPFNFDNADVNADNEVNVMDVTAIINMILGVN